ncbi:hypothetical protein, partial [Streptomyces spongiae]|uniref:hypothetical protein n=1 Tax=Streptomyces spongiae TaxID=565072 RepID=UPI001D13B2D5
GRPGRRGRLRLPSGTSSSGRLGLGGAAQQVLAVIPEPAAAGCVLVLADAPDTAVAHELAG